MQGPPSVRLHVGCKQQAAFSVPASAPLTAKPAAPSEPELGCLRLCLAGSAPSRPGSRGVGGRGSLQEINSGLGPEAASTWRQVRARQPLPPARCGRALSRLDGESLGS